MCMKNLDLYIFESHVVKSKVKISQNFVAFSEYMNFKSIYSALLLFVIKQLKWK